MGWLIVIPVSYLEWKRKSELLDLTPREKMIQEGNAIITSIDLM